MKAGLTVVKLKLQWRTSRKIWRRAEDKKRERKKKPALALNFLTERNQSKSYNFLCNWRTPGHFAVQWFKSSFIPSQAQREKVTRVSGHEHEKEKIDFYCFFTLCFVFMKEVRSSPPKSLLSQEVTWAGNRYLQLTCIPEKEKLTYLAFLHEAFQREINFWWRSMCILQSLTCS